MYHNSLTSSSSSSSSSSSPFDHTRALVQLFCFTKNTLTFRVASSSFPLPLITFIVIIVIFTISFLHYVSSSFPKTPPLFIFADLNLFGCKILVNALCFLLICPPLSPLSLSPFSDLSSHLILHVRPSLPILGRYLSWDLEGLAA
mmetsp:Transcript_42259/g.70366  ORF Transcript_42259/g.70366 Transcript_42259/m.70366 type:complete len:145 (+) Transcript_42259:326-760(+)